MVYKRTEAEIDKSDLAIYCYDKSILFNSIHYKAEFRLSYLYHSTNRSLFIKHWGSAIKKRFDNKNFIDWELFFKDDTLSKNELNKIIDCFCLDNTLEIILIKGQISLLLGDWNTTIELFETISNFSLKNEIFYLLKGYAYMQTKEIDKAAVTFQFAHEINPCYEPVKIGIEKLSDLKNSKYIEIKRQQDLLFINNLEKIKKLISYDKYFFLGIINRYYPLSTLMIEKYFDIWSWDGLSQNENIFWTEELIEKYISNWYWDSLSENESLPWTDDFIQENLYGYDINRLILNNSVTISDYLKEIDFVSGDLTLRKISWHKHSSDHNKSWSEWLIDKYKDYWIWDLLSINTSLPWSEILIEKYKEDWDWNYLSKNLALPWSEKLLDLYKNKWNWFKLSNNTSIPWSEKLVLKYSDVCDILSLWNNKKIIWTYDVIDKFKEKLIEVYYPNIYKYDRSNPILLEVLKDNNSNVWYNISEIDSLNWTIELIEKYENKLYWPYLSQNPALPWTEELIDKFKYNWDWDCLSKNKAIPWSEKLVEKYSKKWNWSTLFTEQNLPLSEHFIEKYISNFSTSELYSLSRNTSIPWSVELIEKYKDKWSWNGLSFCTVLPWSEEFIDKFKYNWNWDCLSTNTSIPWSVELIEKYKDKWSWISLSSNQALPWTSNLIERYKNYWNWGKDINYEDKDKWIFTERENVNDFNHVDPSLFGISFNKGIKYNSSLLEQFKNYWNWNILSINNLITFNVQILKLYKNKWNWNGLSNNYAVPECNMLLDQFNNMWSEKYTNRVENHYDYYSPQKDIDYILNIFKGVEDFNDTKMYCINWSNETFRLNIYEKIFKFLSEAEVKELLTYYINNCKQI